VNNAAYYGDLFRLKGLISAGADPSKPDYDGRTALVFELSFIIFDPITVHFN
jgi:ankyrin repeat protein